MGINKISEVNTTFFVHAGWCGSLSLDEWNTRLGGDDDDDDDTTSQYAILPAINQTLECIPKSLDFKTKQEEGLLFHDDVTREVKLSKSVWERHLHDAYSTHQPVLAHYAQRTRVGDIWEFGCGFGSTPLLRSIIEQSGSPDKSVISSRRLISVESDADWLKSMKLNFPPTSYHHYQLIAPYIPTLNDHDDEQCTHSMLECDERSNEEGKVKSNKLTKSDWEQFFHHTITSQYAYQRNEVSVVFVDNKPMKDRWFVINYFKYIARFIIVHDAPFQQWFDCSFFIQYHEYDSPYCNGPPTAVMTMLKSSDSEEEVDDSPLACTLTPEKDIFHQVFLPPLPP